MYHVSAQGVDERMINVHYYYYYLSIVCAYTFFCFFLYGALRIWLESMCHRNVHCIVRDGGAQDDHLERSQSGGQLFTKC